MVVISVCDLCEKQKTLVKWKLWLMLNHENLMGWIEFINYLNGCSCFCVLIKQRIISSTYLYRLIDGNGSLKVLGVLNKIVPGTLQNTWNLGCAVCALSRENIFNMAELPVVPEAVENFVNLNIMAYFSLLSLRNFKKIFLKVSNT